MKRGDVWWADLPAPWGRRPVVLLARNEAYTLLTWVMVAPLTTTIRDVPTFVTLDPSDDGVPRPSAVNLDSVLVVRPDWLEAFIVRLRPEKLQAIDGAIHFALALKSCAS